MLWDLDYNPFVKQPPLEEPIRRSVFTGRDTELRHLVRDAKQGEPCCVYGTYGMGKSILMLEACRIIREQYPGIIPIYTRVDPGQGYKDFDQIALSVISKAFRDRGINLPAIENESTFDSIRRWTQAGRENGLRVFAMIDDMDRPQDIERISSVIHSVRALRDLYCGVCLPSNPNHATHKFATAGQGILDRIDLSPLKVNEYVQMVSRYLETVRGSIHPSESKIFLSYARPDARRVEQLYNELTNIGFRPWMDTRDLLAGENWPKAIKRQISKSDFVVLCLSPRSYQKRGFIRTEIKMAIKALDNMLNSDIYLVPVRLEDCDIPEEVEDINCIDLFVDGGMAALERSLREGMRRRADSEAKQLQTKSTSLNTFPFEESAIVKIVDRVGGTARLTPRMFNTACRSLLDFAADAEMEKITEDLVDAQWGRIGAQVISGEGNIERCIRLVKQLMEHDGFIEEDGLSLENILGMLNREHGGFAELVEVFGDFKDVFQVEDRSGNMTVSLNPLIDQSFVKDVFLKKSAEEFRQEYGRRGDNDPEGSPPPSFSMNVLPPEKPDPDDLPTEATR